MTKIRRFKFDPKDSSSPMQIIGVGNFAVGDVVELEDASPVEHNPDFRELKAREAKD